MKNVIENLKTRLIERVTNENKSGEENLEVWRKLENTQIQVKYIPYTQKIYKTFSQLNSDHIGNWVVITGTVIQAMQKKTLDKSKLFACCQCGTTYRVRTTYENSYRFEMPMSCTKLVEKEKNKSFIAQLYSNLNKRKNQKQQKEVPELKLQKCGSNKFDPVEKDKICIDYQ